MCTLLIVDERGKAAEIFTRKLNFYGEQTLGKEFNLNVNLRNLHTLLTLLLRLEKNFVLLVKLTIICMYFESAIVKGRKIRVFNIC